MLHVEAHAIIRAEPARVAAIYLDYRNWPDLFPTISGTRLLHDEDGTKTIAVDHWEGQVINLLTVESAGRVHLAEFKRHFDGEFVNAFDPVPGGTCFRVSASIRLKGLAQLLQPFLAGVARRRIAHYVLEPVRAAAEAPPRPTHA
ncbi:MAG TPA: SRPBCC family protein [Opitutus sp.]|nr:SRPBCC family protein [Opitutus sp.]